MLDLSKVKTIRMSIFQPRLKGEPTDPEWTCDMTWLFRFAEDAKVAIAKCEQAKTNSDPIYDLEQWEKDYLQPSEKGCQWCKAKSKCPALAKELLGQVLPPATTDGLDNLDSILEESDGDGSELVLPIKQAIANLPNVNFKTLARMYAVKGLFNDWIDAVESRMLSEMLAGHKSAKWKLIKGQQGNRAWQDADVAEQAMKAMKLKVDEMYDKKVISPTNAEKLLKKRPKLWSKLQPLISRSEGKVKVAPMSAKGESLDPYGEALAALPLLTIEHHLGLVALPGEVLEYKLEDLA